MSVSADGKFLSLHAANKLRILALPGFNASQTATVNLSQGQSQQIDFGNRQAGQTSQIQGTIWNDANRNGIQDAGETGLAGRTVFLDRNTNTRLDAGELSTTTDINGSYTFTGLTAGSYTVTDVLPSGWNQTSPGRSTGDLFSAFIPVPTRRDLIFDSTRNLLYITTSEGRIERYDVANRSLLTPWTVGTSLNGGDITADGRALYVAENQTSSGQGLIRKVDLATGSVSNLSYTLAFGEAGAWDVAIGSDGLGLITTRFSGSGSVPLRQIDLSTDTLSVRPAPTNFGNVQQDTLINRSSDRTSLFFTESNISSGPISFFDANSNAFTKSAETNLFLGATSSAVNRDGSLIAMEIRNDVTVFDRNFKAVENLIGADAGIVFDPTDDVLYAAYTVGRQIVAYDTNTWQERYRLAMAESPGASQTYSQGVMTVSSDGDYLFHSTGTGVRMYELGEGTLPQAHSVNVGFGQTVSNINFGHMQMPR